MTTLKTAFDLQKQDASDAAIDAKIDYAISVVDNYVGWLAGLAARAVPGVAQTLAHRTVLDVGPGPTLGAAVLMACAGARVTVADLDLISWDPDFHPRFFSRLLARVGHRHPQYAAPLRRVIEAGDFHPSVITMLPVAAEELAGTGLTHDIIFSNSTFEHVEDVPLAIRSLWQVTPPGGLGFHHIDFRDHRNFDDPLRFLTLDQATFDAIKAGPMGNFGTRLSLSDFVRCFEAEGFVVTSVHPDGHRASADYVAALRPDLSPKFRDRQDDELNVLGALVCVKRAA